MNASSTRIIDVVEPSADVAGDEPVRGADGRRNDDGEHADRQRDPRTAQHAGEHVAAVPVRAERMRTATAARS